MSILLPAIGRIVRCETNLVVSLASQLAYSAAALASLVGRSHVGKCSIGHPRLARIVERAGKNASSPI